MGRDRWNRSRRVGKYEVGNIGGGKEMVEEEKEGQGKVWHKQKHLG